MICDNYHLRYTTPLSQFRTFCGERETHTKKIVIILILSHRFNWLIGVSVIQNNMCIKINAYEYAERGDERD